MLLSILPFYLPVLGLTNARLTLSGNWQSRTYSTLIHIYRLQQTVGNITNEILAGKDLGIAVFWNFVVIFAFLQQTFHCCVGLSHPDECFWFFGIRWLTYDCLWSGDLTDDTLILKVLHHCKGILDRKMHNKCSVFKIRREQLTCWHVENEFWGQKHGYETDHLKNNLQPEVFDQESKASGFIWLSWSHISFFPTAAGRINFKRWVIDCVYIRREAQSWG